MDESTPESLHVLRFEPVTFARRRRDGWTPERQREFILALSKIGIVAIAARAAGMSRKSAYALLERAGPDSGFARAWEAAVAQGRGTVVAAAIDQALNGIEIPYFYRGIQRGVRRVYDSRLLIAALRAIERAKGGRDALWGRQELSTPASLRRNSFPT